MKTTFLLLCLFWLAGCRDILEETPRANISQSNFYQSRADIVAGLNAVYSIMRTFDYYGVTYNAQLEGMTDYCISRGTQAPVSQYQGLDGTNIARTSLIWTRMYQAINAANIIVKATPPLNLSDQNALVAEARFLRALNYFNLVRSFGAVPIRTEPTETLNQLGGARQPVATVYGQIVADLLDAEKNLPATVTEQGRPTSWAAKTLLAYVYLTTERWADARDKADEVIQSRAFTLVNVQTPADFERIFGAGIGTNSEDVFSLKFARIAGQGWGYPGYFFSADNPNAPGGVLAHFTQPTLAPIRNWDTRDLRRDYNLYTSYVNRAGATVNMTAAMPIGFRKYKDPNSLNPGNNCPILRYPDALLIYAEAASQAANGPTALALERLNMVRRRAYGFPGTAPSSVDYALTGQTAASFRDLVLNERLYEFVSEMKRWYDLKRLGDDRLKATIKAAKNIDVATAHLLWPIPVQELANNPDLKTSDQNPGY